MVHRYSIQFLFLRNDVGIDVNDDVKSLLEIFLIQFVAETLLSSPTGFRWRKTQRRQRSLNFLRFDKTPQKRIKLRLEDEDVEHSAE